MATVKLKVQSRDLLGKQNAKRLRSKGEIPAVLYGEKLESLALSLDARDLRTALSTPSGRNVIIQLGIAGESGVTRVVIRDMARDPVTRTVLHVDFQRISENKPVIMSIPVVVTGESLAVKEGRGILDHTMRQLEVKCLPRDIPESIEVDVSALEVRHAIHVSDLTVANVELLDNPDRPVVEVLMPTLFKEETEEGAEGEAAEGEAAEGEPAGEGAEGEAPAKEAGGDA